MTSQGHRPYFPYSEATADWQHPSVAISFKTNLRNAINQISSLRSIHGHSSDTSYPSWASEIFFPENNILHSLTSLFTSFNLNCQQQWCLKIWNLNSWDQIKSSVPLLNFCRKAANFGQKKWFVYLWLEMLIYGYLCLSLAITVDISRKLLSPETSPVRMISCEHLRLKCQIPCGRIRTKLHFSSSNPGHSCP